MVIFDKIHYLPPVLKDVTCWGWLRFSVRPSDSRGDRRRRCLHVSKLPPLRGI